MLPIANPGSRLRFRASMGIGWRHRRRVGVRVDFDTTDVLGATKGGVVTAFGRGGGSAVAGQVARRRWRSKSPDVRSG